MKPLEEFANSICPVLALGLQAGFPSGSRRHTGGCVVVKIDITMKNANKEKTRCCMSYCKTGFTRLQ